MIKFLCDDAKTLRIVDSIIRGKPSLLICFLVN